MRGREGCNFEKFLVYSASAGSGKTFALSLRYISLLFLDEMPSNILATTFTKKAASQMQTRVRDYLLNLKNEDDFVELLSKETGLSRDEILEKQKRVLEIFLSSTTHIVTIDSFITSILRSNALEIGLEPSFGTIENSLDFERDFLEELEREGMLESFVRLTVALNRKRIASNRIDMMGRLYKIDPILPPLEIEVLKRDGVVEEISKLRVETLALLDEVGVSERGKNNFREESFEKFINRGIFKKDTLLEQGDYKKYVKIEPKIEVNFQKIRTLIANYFRAEESYVLHKIFDLYSHYRNIRISKAKATNRLNFDDLSYFAYRLLHKTLKRDFLYFKLDSKFRHILLDEFQDTSTVQFLIFKPLIDEILSGVGQDDFRSFFYVGDPKQSLYRFRGGQEELFSWVAEHYRLPVRELDRNYRSYRNIVNSVNGWFDEVIAGFTPQKAESQKDGYVKVYESEDIFKEAVESAKELIKAGVNASDITFLVVQNSDGIELQNVALKSGLKTILQTANKLNRFSKILALVSIIEYLYTREESKLYNLLFRVGIDSPEDLDFSWFKIDLKPVEIIDELIKRFDYFEDEANILNLLDFASKYGVIGEFLEEFENSKLDIATKSLFGAIIMTIHTSKGLEFDYVIVLDRKKDGKGRSDAILLEKYNEKLHIEKFFYKKAIRARFDEEYSKLIEREDTLSRKDSLNMLYVALTRAKKGLIVVKKEKKSLFDPLKTMRPVEFGEIEKSKKSEREIEILNYPDIGSYGSQETPKRDLVDIEYDYYASLFGTALHYLLEMMREFSLSSLSQALEATQNRFGTLLKEREIMEIKSRVERLLESEEFNSMLEGAKISKEQPLSFGGELYRLDLLLEYEDSVAVVDYKSSKNSQGSHRKQVLEYCEMVSAITKKSTKGYICYILKDSVEIKAV